MDYVSFREVFMAKDARFVLDRRILDGLSVLRSLGSAAVDCGDDDWTAGELADLRAAIDWIDTLAPAPGDGRKKDCAE